MDCSTKSSSIFFCSIWMGNRILYSHCSDNIDLDPEAMASAAIECTPPLHSRFSHTAGDRTFAFLIDDDGHTYFAIAGSPSGSAAALRFLELMRDGFCHASKSGVHGLIASLEAEEVRIALGAEGSNKADLILRSRRRSCWPYVKIVLAVDLILCFILLGIWLAVCRASLCIS